MLLGKLSFESLNSAAVSFHPTKVCAVPSPLVHLPLLIIIKHSPLGSSSATKINSPHAWNSSWILLGSCFAVDNKDYRGHTLSSAVLNFLPSWELQGITGGRI